MKRLQKTWRINSFKHLSLKGVAYYHIFMNFGSHTFPEEGSAYNVVSFEKPHMACRWRIMIFFQNLEFELGRVGKKYLLFVPQYVIVPSEFRICSWIALDFLY
jgi:hypothetical protein